MIFRKSKTEFKSCEVSTTKKVLLNICDYLRYGLTDSNIFYRNLYINPEKDYNELNCRMGGIKLGSNFYSTILSYHIIANMVCVLLPKTEYNLIPFSYKAFRNCCNNLREYILKNEIKEIHTPVFGKEILEGNWLEIEKIIVEVCCNGIEDLNLFVYK